MKYIFCIVIIFFLIANSANAQFFITGQDPSSIKWRQINTENFQVIYPEEFDKEAQRVAFVLEKVYEFGSRSVNHSPSKISVVLHTRTTNSNGLVAWAPKRIELFTTPNQQIYSQDWIEQLAIHEYRHLVQLDKIQSELPFLVKFILGEQATGIVTGAYLPLWFMEGDAVVNETALSHSGRGRLASFSMDYRAQLAEKGIYSFNKAYLGSYKDFVPDHYKLGYWMVGKTRERYGAQIWSEVLDKVGNKPLSVTPFNSVLKKKTGLSDQQLYRQVFTDLTNEWKQDQKVPLSFPAAISPKKKIYTNYIYSEFYQDSLILAYRTSMNDIGRFVLIHPNRKEELIFTPGYIFDESVSFRKNLIIWAERQADIRWVHAERSVISVYDIETKNSKRLKFANKLFSPVISPDLISFAAVEVDNENNYFLSVFDLSSGILKKRCKTVANQYLFTPCWDEKGESLYFVALSSKGKYLASYDLPSGRFQQLTTASFVNIKNPVFTNNQLLFCADFSGKDDLYSLNIADGKIYHVYSPAYGVDYPSAANNKNQFLYSNYTSDGYQLSILNLGDNLKRQTISDLSLQSNRLAHHLASQETGIPEFNVNDTIKYPSSRYSKSGHLFNFHSWAPAYVDVNSYEIRPGVSLFSQNTLGTAETRIGYDYDVTQKAGRYVLAFNYYGLFPQFNTSLSYGKNISDYIQITDSIDRFGNVISRNTTYNTIHWSDFSADFNVRLPLNLSRGKYSIGLFPEIQYNFSHLKPLDFTGDTLYSGNYHALTYRLYHYLLLHQSAQSLMPKWGYQLDLSYKHTPFGDFHKGTLRGVQSVLYFPGLMNNHGIKIYQGYQVKNYHAGSHFSNIIRFPRGIYRYENNRMYSLAVDYRMPLSYPDASLGKFVYLKRIKSTLFYDYAWLSYPLLNENHVLIPNSDTSELNSMGLELTADIHVLRLFAPMEIGFRSVYLPQTGNVAFNLLFSIDFNGF